MLLLSKFQIPNLSSSLLVLSSKWCVVLGQWKPAQTAWDLIYGLQKLTCTKSLGKQRGSVASGWKMGYSLLIHSCITSSRRNIPAVQTLLSERGSNPLSLIWANSSRCLLWLHNVAWQGRSLVGKIKLILNKNWNSGTKLWCSILFLRHLSSLGFSECLSPKLHIKYLESKWHSTEGIWLLPGCWAEVFHFIHHSQPAAVLPELTECT